jgi:hypothetical protein
MFWLAGVIVTLALAAGSVVCSQGMSNDALPTNRTISAIIHHCFGHPFLGGPAGGKPLRPAARLFLLVCIGGGAA